VRSITDLFIRRPILAIVLNVLILLAGAQAVRTLNVRQYPRSENASVTVTTVYVGASADLIRGFITAPLERAIAGADGIDYLESQSALSLSTITAHLKLNQDSRKALAEISSKVEWLTSVSAVRMAVSFVRLPPASWPNSSARPSGYVTRVSRSRSSYP